MHTTGAIADTRPVAVRLSKRLAEPGIIQNRYSKKENNSHILASYKKLGSKNKKKQEIQKWNRVLLVDDSFLVN